MHNLFRLLSEIYNESERALELSRSDFDYYHGMSAAYLNVAKSIKEILEEDG